MIFADPNFVRLGETQSLILGFIFEEALLVDKGTGLVVNLGSFYGDAAFGLISLNDEWCIVGGESLSLWKAGGDIIRIEFEELKLACDARQIGPYEVELLIDPWSDQGGIWRINIQTLERYRLKTIDKRHEPYSENIDW